MNLVQELVITKPFCYQVFMDSKIQNIQTLILNIHDNNAFTYSIGGFVVIEPNLI